MIKTAIVNSKELGTNCWLTARFLDGVRCQRVMECSYPEKKTCKAVETEIVARKESAQRRTTEIAECLARDLDSLEEKGGA